MWTADNDQHLPRLHTGFSFDSPHEECVDVKQRLAAAYRIFAKLNLNEGLAGHLTARDPILLDHFWVNPIGMSFRLLRSSDLCLVDHRATLFRAA